MPKPLNNLLTAAARVQAHRLMPTRHGALLLEAGQHPQGRTHLSAASGLVRSGAQLFVVADDELHLGVFEDTLGGCGALRPGRLVRLLDGDLPAERGARKKAKPDLETLALLPPLPGCTCGALLALGSGSQSNRETGVLLALGAPGMLNGRTASVQLAPLYAPLRKRFADLNIEGAWVSSGELLLLQRGNKGDAHSACIRYDWNLMAPWLAGLQPLPPAAKSVQVLNLGSVDGVPLSLTDGVPLPNGEWMFSAVAEDTLDSVADGACVASALGVVTPEGLVRTCVTLQGEPKVEGIALQTDGDEWLVTMVTDPDDPNVPSQCLMVRMARRMASG
ncbi:MAG: hypothetical protein H7293_08140 [Candidatus Saccharibacteria bacterium]|nr:hypothetical protein [Rhodoferax sp.]